MKATKLTFCFVSQICQAFVLGQKWIERVDKTAKTLSRYPVPIFPKIIFCKRKKVLKWFEVVTTHPMMLSDQKFLRKHVVSENKNNLK